MTALMTKSVSVFERVPGTRAFTPSDDEEPRNHWLVLDLAVDYEMGLPSCVTVTVEPGDRLNEEG